MTSHQLAKRGAEHILIGMDVDRAAVADLVVALAHVDPGRALAAEQQTLVGDVEDKINARGWPGSRVFVRLGGQARCFYLSGGPTGVALDGLLDQMARFEPTVPIIRMARYADLTLMPEATPQ